MKCHKFDFGNSILCVRLETISIHLSKGYTAHPEQVNLNLMWNRKQMRPLKTKQKIMQIEK